MEGKVVLVTGANGGLGTYVTQAFLDAGATVIGTSRKIQQSDFSSPSFTALAAEISSREDAQGSGGSSCRAFRKARCSGTHGRRVCRWSVDRGHRRCTLFSGCLT